MILQSPSGRPGEREGPIGIALGEREVLAVRIAKAHVALGEREAVVRTAAVESLIRRAAHALGRDRARHGIGAVGACDVRVGAVADAGLAAIDDRRVGKADGHVVAGRPELLEEARLADPEERIVGLLAVQSVGLEPLFASRDPVGRRRGHHAVPSRHQVGNDGLARQRGQRYAVRFELRAGHDRAGDARLSRIVQRQSVKSSKSGTHPAPSCRIDRSRQAVRQRHVEHVVGHLSGRIAGAAGIVEQGDVEAAQARLVGRQHVDSAAGVLLAVEREVVLEHEHRELRRREWSGLRQYTVTAVSCAGQAIGAPPMPWPAIGAPPFRGSLPA